MNSTHDLKVVCSNLVSSNILDGNGVKAMPGSIPASNSGSIWKFRKNVGSQMGHTFCKMMFTNEIQLNSKVYSSFASIYINPVIN